MKNKENSTKRLLLGVLISLTVLAVTAICTLGALFINTQRDLDIIVIPSFEGKKYSELGAYDKIKFECELVYSNDVPEGEIISQSPYSGARRKVSDGEFCTVKLTVSMGAENCTLPDLSGFAYTEAAGVLRSLGAQIRVISVYDDEGESDHVLYTSPAAGSRLEHGDRVTLFVCRKHVKGSVRVGDFTGLDQGAACARMLADGLLVGDITLEPSDKVENGLVISQSIAPGSYVRYHTRISITVSSGNQNEIDQLHPFGRYITDGDKQNGEINGSED